MSSHLTSGKGFTLSSACMNTNLLFSASRQHMFLGGIWCSTKKPPTAECLGPNLEEIQGLTADGKCCYIGV